MAQLNRWHVFEHMKYTYMAAGLILTHEEVRGRFEAFTPAEEIVEGIAEFQATVGSLPVVKGCSA